MTPRASRSKSPTSRSDNESLTPAATALSLTTCSREHHQALRILPALRVQRAHATRLGCSPLARYPSTGRTTRTIRSTAFMRRLTRVPVLPVGVLVQLYYLVLPVVRSLRGTIGGLQSYVSAQCRQTGKSKCMRRGALLALALAGDGDHAHLGLPAAAARASAAHSCEGHCAKIACVGGCSAICMWRAAHL